VNLLLRLVGTWLPKNRWLRRLVITVVGLIALTICGMYGIAEWYLHTEASTPTQLGVSFVPDYAQSLGVDPQKTMDALIGIGVKQFRLVSYWSDMEPTPGHYDFSQLDWEFQKAEAAHAHIILTVGLRQPRWPECHMPGWAANEPISQWQPQLENFMTAVVNRYKNSPALISYQVENEYFLQGFGTCSSIPNVATRSRLVSEYNLVSKLDPEHPIIIARSDNALGIPVRQPQPAEFSISIYRRVWDATFTHRYLQYPFPSWYYAFLAGTQKIFLHKDMMIGELQAEAWAPNGKTIPQISIAEQNKSFDAQRFTSTVNFAKNTGMKSIDLWGAEYWYYRQQVLHDPSLMNVARQEFSAPSEQ
jgi:hypothetical protein